ncbi:RNA polymerase sigma factor [Micromonospora yangpuensis]|uniref:RNA polymerase sigma-70 factor, ECF subfamily n=1 Tax=Micromonospora yangpuensis TaxID=683228 RepID=A0A1C6U442_9ACTN|nr:RNA polymerase sigma factor [Micromonospora yangpuensis]GGL93359.1 RNA polymerase sigma factor [Micromonospora yangpuensis]SCL48639.1 RNA polymerase sigma-70 factor, ECF subfamily [Micromonospora yangpuensis]
MTTPTGNPRHHEHDDRPPEWDLVRRAQHGDRDAFGQLYQHHHNRVLGHVTARVGSHQRHLAEDITAETFLRAWKNLHQYTQPRRPIIAWLHTIAHRLVLDHARARRNRPEHPAGLTDDYHATENHHTTSAEAAVIAKYDLQQALTAYQHLDPRHRTCLHLRHWRGLTVPQTAMALHTTIDNVQHLEATATHAITQHRTTDIPLPHWHPGHHQRR